MASIQFSGLSSGLDTAGIISKLMSVESAPQTALKARVATQQSQVAELQRINTSVLSLKDSAASFTTGSTWTKLTATSSSTAVSVTASSTALPASLGLKVNSLAAPAQTTVGTGALAGGDAFTLVGTDGQTVALDAKGSLANLATAINATTKTSGVQAQLVRNTTAGDVLLLTTATTGSAASFTLTDGAATAYSASGTSASVTLDAGITVTSQTNTFTNLLPGVDVTIAPGTAKDTQAVVTVADDGSARANAMKSFIGQINGLLSGISADTAYGAITAGKAATGAGILTGDSTLRGLASQLVNAVLSPDAAKLLTGAGVGVDRDGQLTFDAAAFQAAYVADPTGIQNAFVGKGGLTDRVAALATRVSDPFTGSLTTAIKGRQTEIDRSSDRIAAWDDRLAMKQASLEQQYAALETVLSRLQSQQSWLAGQIESLDGLSGSK